MNVSSRFLTPLRNETIGERLWMLTDDLVFYSAKYQGIFVAPRGFQHNLASIPRVAQSIIPKVGRYDKAAVIHDGGYGNALVTEKGQRIFCVKRVADDLFYEGMKAEGVNGFLAWMMHRAVKIGGNPAGHPLANALPEVADGRIASFVSDTGPE